MRKSIVRFVLSLMLLLGLAQIPASAGSPMTPPPFCPPGSVCN